MRANEAMVTRPFVSCWPFCNGASACLLEYRRYRHRHNILSAAGIGIAALVIVFAVALREARLNDEQFVPKAVVHNPSYEDGFKLVMEMYDGGKYSGSFWVTSNLLQRRRYLVLRCCPQHQRELSFCMQTVSAHANSEIIPTIGCSSR